MVKDFFPSFLFFVGPLIRGGRHQFSLAHEKLTLSLVHQICGKYRVAIFLSAMFATTNFPSSSSAAGRKNPGRFSFVWHRYTLQILRR